MLSFRLSTFFIGLLALLPLGLALSTTPAMAHCDGVKHGPGHPHCDGGEPPPPVQPQVLVLRDGNNAIIGEVAAFKNDGNIISSVEIVYRGDPIDAVFFEDFPLAVLRVWFFPERYGPDPIWAAWEDETIAVYFTSTNCTGTPYLRYFKFVNIAFDFPRLSIADVSGGGQDIFVPLDVTETPTNRTTGSTYSQSTGLCEGHEVNYDLITGTRVHVNFPRPYTVGF